MRTTTSNPQDVENNAPLDYVWVNSSDVKLRFTYSAMSRPNNGAQRIFSTSEASKMIRKLLALSLSTLLILSGCGQGTVSNPAGNGNANTTPPPAPPTPTTAQAAIKHVVVIFDENISFDHYFGTYPNAANTGGTTFTPATAATVAAATAAGTTSLPATPTITNNYISNPTLLTANPNLNVANNSTPTSTVQNSVAANPFRLGPNQAATNDQDHNYNPEQLAFDNGKMDLFPMSVGTADGSLTPSTG